MARKFNDNIDLAGNQLAQVVLENLAADPGTLLGDGRIWYDTVLKAARLRSNGATVSLAAGASYTDEQAQDAIGAAFAAGVQTGVTVTYDDAGNALSIQRSALTGDVTASAGSNATTIAANAVTTAKILDANVTLAKLANIPTLSLVGRNTAASGVPENILLGASLSMDGAGNLQRAALTGDVTAPVNSNATTIAASAVTNAKLANMAANSIKGNNTGSPAVALDLTTAQVKTLLAIANTDVSGLGSLATVSNLTGPVTSTGAATAVTNNAITNAMLAQMATLTIKGNNTGGTANALDLTAAQVKTLLAIANTDVSGLGTLATVSNLTGNVTSVGAATTIAASAVTNAMHANMAATTIKGNNTGSPAAPLDLTVAQTKTLLAIVPGDVTGFDTQVRTSRLDQMTAPTASVSMNSQLLTNVLTPVSGTDAANKNYVDATAQGLAVKPSARVATTGVETFTVASGSVTQIAGTTIDGVSPAVGDRILVKDAPAVTGVGSVNSTQPGNGVYTVTNATTNLTLSRVADLSGSNNPAGAFVFVEAGTANLSSGWVVATPSSAAAFTYGTNNIAFTQFSGAGEITAGSGLTKTGNSLAVNVSTGVEIVSNNVRLAAAGAGTGLTGGAGAALAVNPGTSLELSGNTVRLAAAAAGAGLTGGGASALSVDHTVVPKLFVGAITGGATSEVVTHNLGTRDVMVLVYLAAGTFAEEEFSVEHTSTNTVTIRSAITIPTTTYRVVVFG